MPVQYNVYNEYLYRTKELRYLWNSILEKLVVHFRETGILKSTRNLFVLILV